jgi:hypothetical protein
MTRRPADRARDLTRPKREIKTITPLIDRILNHLVFDKMTAQEAATATGQHFRFVCRALSSAAVLKEMNARIEEVRVSARARNIHAAMAVRDLALKPAGFTAAEGTAALKAAQWLHGEPDSNAGKAPGTAIPGYVIMLPMMQPPAQQQGSDAKPLIELQPVGQATFQRSEKG